MPKFKVTVLEHRLHEVVEEASDETEAVRIVHALENLPAGSFRKVTGREAVDAEPLKDLSRMIAPVYACPEWHNVGVAFVREETLGTRKSGYYQAFVIYVGGDYRPLRGPVATLAKAQKIALAFNESHGSQRPADLSIFAQPG